MNGMGKTGIIIFGGTGFGAGELLRLLVNHPNVDIVSVISESKAGKKVSEVHTFLDSVYNLKFSKTVNEQKLSNYNKLVLFFALPHGVSAKKISELSRNPLYKKAIFIDLSGDFRLKESKIHQKFYPETEVFSALRKKFVYGLSEINRAKIKKAQFIANPGCYVTAASLALYPLVKKISGKIIIDGKSGTSGAGRGLSDTLHHPLRNANLQAYKILDHRHEPEIYSALGDAKLKKLKINFVPHLMPVSRGMLVTCYLTLKETVSTEKLNNYYKSFYKNSLFIRVKDSPAEIRNVVGSNFCDLHITARGKDVVITSALDNLVKGMAGQAIQNMNLILGLKEDTGLANQALGLV